MDSISTHTSLNKTGDDGNHHVLRTVQSDDEVKPTEAAPNPVVPPGSFRSVRLTTLKQRDRPTFCTKRQTGKRVFEITEKDWAPDTPQKRPKIVQETPDYEHQTLDPLSQSQPALPANNRAQASLTDFPLPVADARPTQDRSEHTLTLRAGLEQAHEQISGEPVRSSELSKVSSAKSPVKSRRAKVSGENRVTVLFASSSSYVQKRRDDLELFFKSHGGVEAANAMSDFDVLVIGNGKYGRTPKLLFAVTQGKPVVTDTWLSKSYGARRLLDPSLFAPDDKNKRANVEEYDPTDRSTRHGLLQDRKLFMTPALKRLYEKKNTYTEMKMLCSVLGAFSVDSKAARDIIDDIAPSRTTGKYADVVVLGLDHGDNDAASLLTKGCTVFNDQMLPVSILRGRLDLTSPEFRLSKSRTTAHQGLSSM